MLRRAQSREEHCQVAVARAVGILAGIDGDVKAAQQAPEVRGADVRADRPDEASAAEQLIAGTPKLAEAGDRTGAHRHGGEHDLGEPGGACQACERGPQQVLEAGGGVGQSCRGARLYDQVLQGVSDEALQQRLAVGKVTVGRPDPDPRILGERVEAERAVTAGELVGARSRAGALGCVPIQGMDCECRFAIRWR